MAFAPPFTDPGLPRRSAHRRGLLPCRPFPYALLTVVLTAFVGVFYLSTLRAGHNWDGDYALYIMHARNIVKGWPYASTGYVYNPDRPLYPRAYPPGLPLLLVPVYALSGVNLHQMKMVGVVAFILFVPIFAATVWRFFPSPIALAVTAVVALHPAWWEFKDTIFSELPFVLFCYAALYLVDRLHQTGAGLRPAAVAGAAAALACACLTRMVGVVLLPVIFLLSVHQSKRVIAPGTVAAVIAAVVVILVNTIFPSDATTYFWLFKGYSGYLTRSLGACVRNAGQYASVIVDLVVHHVRLGPWLTPIAAGGFVALVLLGWIARARARLSVYEAFFIAYALFFVIYPNASPHRYSLPLWPLFFFYAFCGARAAGGWIGNVAQRGTPALLCGAFCLVYAAHYVGVPGTWPVGLRSAKVDFGPIPYSVTSPTSRELFNAIKANLPPGAALLARKPTIIALFTDRRAAVWPQEFSDHELWGYMHRIGASYIVENRLDAGFGTGEPRDNIHGFIRRNRAALRLLFFNQWFNLYEVRAGAPH